MLHNLHMGYKGFLSGIAGGALAAGIALVMVILGLSPEKGAWSFFAFFGALFFTLAGFFTLASFYLRRAIKGTEILYASVPVSFRQGVLISVFLTGILALNAFEILYFWDAILLFFSIMLLELYFRTRISQ